MTNDSVYRVSDGGFCYLIFLLISGGDNPKKFHLKEKDEYYAEMF